MAGRPSKYNKDAQAIADAYVSGGYVGAGDAVPSISGMSEELGVTRSTVYLWAEQNTQFSDTLARCNQKQERVALSKGLTGDFNSAIVKLLLANHGYSDKQALDHTSSDGSMKPTTIEIVAGDKG